MAQEQTDQVKAIHEGPYLDREARSQMPLTALIRALPKCHS